MVTAVTDAAILVDCPSILRVWPGTQCRSKRNYHIRNLNSIGSNHIFSSSKQKQ